MSDLQDIIARQGVIAFNSGHTSGFSAGQEFERNLIRSYIEELRQEAEPGMVADYLFCDDLLEYIEKRLEPLK